DGQAEVRYDDGSKLLRFDHVEARFLNAEGRGRIELKEGRVRGDVTHPPVDRPLVFSTPHADATILGTTFELTASRNDTLPYTLAGRVRLATERQSVDVGQGERASAD